MASLRRGFSGAATSAQRDFLALEPKASGSEALYDSGWKALNSGAVEAAIAVFNELLLTESQNDKLWLSRGLAHAQSEQWTRALADFSRYCEITDAKEGQTLASAYYGRALCLARLGHRLEALEALDQCLAVGPKDEQLTETNPSYAPHAAVARGLLLQDESLAGAYRSKRAPAAATSGSASAAAAPAAAVTRTAVEYGGAVWRCPPTLLEEVLERAAAEGKTPLLLDPSEEKVSETYFLYRPSTIVDAKRLVMQVRVAGLELAATHEQLRKDLVHAMRWGHTLVVRMANSAADFANAYCDEAHFPLKSFDALATPAGCELGLDGSVTLSEETLGRKRTQLHADGSLNEEAAAVAAAERKKETEVQGADVALAAREAVVAATRNLQAKGAFTKVLREGDVDPSGATAGRLPVLQTFRLIVSTHFGEDNYEELLRDSLPLGLLQPILLLEASQCGAAVVQETARQHGPVDDAELAAAGWGGLAGRGAPMAKQLQGDRETLFLQS